MQARTDIGNHMVTDPAAFRALADPTRRALLDLLRGGGKPVHELASHFPMSRPAISKHLRLLREAALVVERREGREIYYELNASPLIEVDRWMEKYRELWQTRLKRLKTRVESRREGRAGGEARGTRRGGTERGHGEGADG
jgi:DNA-binding transcriptional ArsR family regulator